VLLDYLKAHAHFLRQSESLSSLVPTWHGRCTAAWLEKEKVMLIATLLAQMVIAQGAPYALAPASRLWIEGDSNLHAWTCEAKKVDAQLDVDPGTPQMARGLSVHVPTADIDCGHGNMNDKLREALKTKSIDFKLISAERMPGEGVKIKARGSLTIAGVTKVANLVVDGTLQPDGSIEAKGALPMKMSWFGVEAPSALFLKTYDDITVKFDLRVAQPRS
jgi:polyisoprenoid-binding protein YceI